MANLTNESKSYKTVENATKALAAKLTLIGRTLDNTRWLISANADGRFVPVVVPGSEVAVFMPLAFNGITLVG